MHKKKGVPCLGECGFYGDPDNQGFCSSCMKKKKKWSWIQRKNGNWEIQTIELILVSNDQDKLFLEQKRLCTQNDRLGSILLDILQELGHSDEELINYELIHPKKIDAIPLETRVGELLNGNKLKLWVVNQSNQEVIILNGNYKGSHGRIRLGEKNIPRKNDIGSYCVDIAMDDGSTKDVWLNTAMIKSVYREVDIVGGEYKDQCGWIQVDEKKNLKKNDIGSYCVAIRMQDGSIKDTWLNTALIQPKLSSKKEEKKSESKQPLVLEDGSWDCPRCTFSNDSNNQLCGICDHPCPQSIPLEKWSCRACTFVQTNQNVRCEMCNTPREDIPENDNIEDALPPTGNPNFVRNWSDKVSNSVKKAIMRVEPDFYCEICMENVAVSKKANLCCPHEYCRSCMEDYVSLEIREARVLNVTCPGQEEKTGKSCTAPFSKKDIQDIVDEKTWKQYQRFVKKKTDKTFVECPYCNQTQKGNKIRPKMKCEREECGKEFCFIHSNAHVGMSCGQYKKKHKEEFQRDKKFKEETSIRCPVIYCGVRIYKSEGCNHMTCNQCHTDFCYLCGDDYMGSMHFHEWNLLGCPDMQMTSGMKPNCRRNPLRTCLSRLIIWPCGVLLMTMMCLWGETCWLVGLAVCCPAICAVSIYKCYDDGFRDFFEDLAPYICAGCVGPVLAVVEARANPTILCRRDMVYSYVLIALIIVVVVVVVPLLS